MGMNWLMDQRMREVIDRHAEDLEAEIRRRIPRLMAYGLPWTALYLSPMASETAGSRFTIQQVVVDLEGETEAKLLFALSIAHRMYRRRVSDRAMVLWVKRDGVVSTEVSKHFAETKGATPWSQEP